MQLIERSLFGVRAVVYEFGRRDAGLKIVLFPMLHVGIPSYYAEIRRRLEGCDVILAEGVRSRVTGYITLTYRIVNRVKRLGLVSQDAALDLRPFSARLLKPDMRGADFDKRWWRLALPVKAVLYLVVPFYVAWLYFFGTRRFLARYAAQTDLPDRDEVMTAGTDLGGFSELLIHDRDSLLLNELESYIEEHRTEQRTVGVLYGAAHMPAVVHLLTGKLRFSVRKADWVTVFPFPGAEAA